MKPFRPYIVALQAGLLIAAAISVQAATSGAARSVSDPRSWKPWLLEAPGQFRLPAPPSRHSNVVKKELRELVRLQGSRTARSEKKIRAFNRQVATRRWTRVTLQMIVKYRPRPPFAARLLALVHNAMYDALIAARDSRSAYQRPPPSRLDQRIHPISKPDAATYPPDSVVIASAAATVLAYVFPHEPAATFQNLVNRVGMMRLRAGLNYRSDVTQGQELGAQVGGLFIARGQSDGSDSVGFSNERPQGEEFWEPTPPDYIDPPSGGPVGLWQPWVMTSPSEGRVVSAIPPPNPYGSESFMEELREVIEVQADLTTEQEEIATFWDDGPATFTPPGHWNDIALEVASILELGTPATVFMFSLINAALADAAIAVFEAKYEWWSIRPITAVRRLCDGGARLCTDAELDPDAGGDPAQALYPNWLSYITTPPFPAYPGGHSTFSGAAGEILTHFFPEVGDDINRQAEEAASSRLYGGIHFRSDNDSGLVLGRAVAGLVLERVAGLPD